MPSAEHHEQRAGFFALLALAATLIPSAASADTDMPLSSLLSPSTWTNNSPFPLQGDLAKVLQAVRVTDFSSHSAPDAHLEVEVKFTGEIDLTISALAGFGLVVGQADPAGKSVGEPGATESNGLRLRFDYGDSPQQVTLSSTRADEVLGLLLLPAALKAEGTGAPAAIAIKAGPGLALVADTAGHLLLQGLELGRTEIGDTGIVLSATDVVLDLDPDQSPLAAGDSDGSFQGVVLGQVTVDLPSDLGGVEQLTASDFVIGAEGVTGRIEATLAGVDFEVGGIGTTLSSICVQITDSTAELCGVGGTMELPADYFACAADPDTTLPVSLSFTDGVYSGVVELAALPADCQRIRFGGVEGSYLDLSGAPVHTYDCASRQVDPTPVIPAAFLRIEATPEPFEIRLAGFAEAAATNPRPIGVLHLDEELLRPSTEADGILLPASLALGPSGFCLGCQDTGLGLPLMEVGSSGVEVCADDVALDLDEATDAWIAGQEPEGTAPGGEWKGFYAADLEVTLPFTVQGSANPASFAAQGLAIGPGGVNGTFTAQDAIPTVEFAGYEVRLATVSVGFVHNTPTAVDVTGDLTVPFLDRDLRLGFALDGQGDWLASIATADGLPIDASRKLGAVELRMLLSRASVGCEGGDCFVQMDATVGLVTSAFSTGDIALEALRIDEQGKVLVQGGWYTFAEPKRIGIAGFSYELSRLGFGNRDDGRRWVALGGVFQLQDLLPVDLKVHDVAVSWDPGTPAAPTFADPRLEISAIKLAMEIENVLTLEGALLWCSSGKPGCNGGDADLGNQWFEGQVDVALVSPPMAIGGRVLVGKNRQEGWTFWYAQVDAQLPAGITLGSIPLSIYGFSGGFGKNVALVVTKEFPRHLDLANPITPQRGSFVFVAGCTLGTTFDNGFALNTDATLLVQVPGVVAVLNGQAWVLTERSQRKLPPLITADIIFDGVRREFLIALAARYQNRENVGDIVDLNGSFEVLLSAQAWHLFLGTRAQPISAEIFKDFVPLQAAGYLMFGTDVPFDSGPRRGFVVGASLRLESEGSALGGAVGYAFALYAGGDLALQMHPKHVLVVVELGGNVAVHVGPVSTGLSLEAALKGQLPTPYEVGASARLEIDLPWPLGDVGFNVEVSWTKPSAPPAFSPTLKQIVFESEATGRTVTAFDAQTQSACPASAISGVPFDSIAKLTFNRRVDCRDPASVRRCSANSGSDDFFRDTVGNCAASSRFTGWTVSPVGGAPAPSVEGGWGGALGAPETGAAAERRYETFSFLPVRYAFESCPGGGSNAGLADACTAITEIPKTCRIISELRACAEEPECSGPVRTFSQMVGDDDQGHPGNDADWSGPGKGWPGCPFGQEPTPFDSPQINACRVWHYDYEFPLGACVRGARLRIKWYLTDDRACASCPRSPRRLTEALSLASARLGRIDFDRCHEAFSGAMFGNACPPPADSGIATLDLADFPGALERLDGTPLTVSLTDDTMVDYAVLEIDYTLPNLPRGSLANRYLATGPRQVFEHEGELSSLGRCSDPASPGFAPCPGTSPSPAVPAERAFLTSAGGLPGACCCPAARHPVVCADGRGGARVVSGYAVDDDKRLWAVELDGSSRVVGRCEPLAGPAFASCPSLDPVLCGQLAASPPVVCRLDDGTPVAPRPEEITTSIQCPPEAPAAPAPGAPFCPNLQYRFRLDTETRAASSATGTCDAAPNTPQTCEVTYTVEPPPPSLEPYVVWTSPAQSARPVYRADDVVVQFGSAALCELFGCCPGMHPLDLELRKADATEPADVVAGTLRRQGCNEALDSVPTRLGQPDDFLVFDPAADLEPEARYLFTLPGPPAVSPVEPYLKRFFVTSRFATFTEALAGARAYAAGDTVYLETAEALDWLHVTASLAGRRIDGRRISEAGASVHVFVLDEPGDPQPSPGSSLTLRYHSIPHGRCGCAVNAHCPGGGRCADGLCLGGLTCDAAAECALGSCTIDGPVVRRGGLAIDEPVTLVLLDGS